MEGGFSDTFSTTSDWRIINSNYFKTLVYWINHRALTIFIKTKDAGNERTLPR